MADAGYTEKNADGFYVNANGEVCVFTLTCNAGKEAHVGYAELVKTQLEQFGIQVVLETLDADSYNAKTSNKFSENNITMEAAIYGYTAAGTPVVRSLQSSRAVSACFCRTFLFLFLPGSGWQSSGKPARAKRCWRSRFWGFSPRTCGCMAAVSRWTATRFQAANSCKCCAATKWSTSRTPQ